MQIMSMNRKRIKKIEEDQTVEQNQIQMKRFRVKWI